MSEFYCYQAIWIWINWKRLWLWVESLNYYLYTKFNGNKPKHEYFAQMFLTKGQRCLWVCPKCHLLGECITLHWLKRLSESLLPHLKQISMASYMLYFDDVLGHFAERLCYWSTLCIIVSSVFGYTILHSLFQWQWWSHPVMSFICVYSIPLAIKCVND